MEYFLLFMTVGTLTIACFVTSRRIAYTGSTNAVSSVVITWKAIWIDSTQLCSSILRRETTGSLNSVIGRLLPMREREEIQPCQTNRLESTCHSERIRRLAGSV